VILPAFKAGDSALRESNGGFDSHTLPPHLVGLTEEAGKGRLRGDAKREATSNDVHDLRQENERLKLLVTDLSLENLTLKKSQY